MTQIELVNNKLIGICNGLPLPLIDISNLISVSLDDDNYTDDGNPVISETTKLVFIFPSTNIHWILPELSSDLVTIYEKVMYLLATNPLSTPWVIVPVEDKSSYTYTLNLSLINSITFNKNNTLEVTYGAGGYDKFDLMPSEYETFKQLVYTKLGICQK